MRDLIIATHNTGKLREFSALLAPLGINVKSAGELGISDPEETGATFFENAQLKARHAAAASNLPALADDSGLVIPALGGAPGIYSARWAGKEKDFSMAFARIQSALSSPPACGGIKGGAPSIDSVGSNHHPHLTSPVIPASAGRGGKEVDAYFICVLSLAQPSGECVNFEGRINGTLTFPPRGAAGFGYDPIFTPDGYDVTFAEMDANIKQKISHRAMAFAKFLEYMSSCEAR